MAFVKITGFVTPLEPVAPARPDITRSWIESLEARQLLSIANPSPVSPAAFVAPVMHAQATRVAPAAVVTDKLNYVPGQVAAITGTGFGANEQVRVQVLHIDGTPNTAPEHQPWIVRADKNGTFHTTYHVSADDMNTTLRLTATGLTSHRTATEIFKDATTATTTTLASSASPSVFGQPVTFTATVTTGATGTVTFVDGTTTLGSATLSSAKATFVASSLSVATHSITAKYAGDSSHSASTSAVFSQAVHAAATTVAISSSSAPTQAPIVKPSHIVIVVEEDRGANAVGDTANMPYFNQLASSGLVYSNSHGLNTTAQDGQMSYLGLYSGSTQGVTDNSNHGLFTGVNLAQSLANNGMSFSGYAEALPHAGDTTDNYAADPSNAAYDDLYVRAYNPMAQFSNVGSGLTNASVNQTFSSFPTSASGYANLPTVSFVIPDTLHNTHGSNDTDPFATDPSAYNLLRQNADTWLKQNLDGFLQWAKQSNSLLIVTEDEGDRAHNFAGGFATIVNGDARLFAPGVDTTNVTPYSILRTVETMYGLPLLGASATSSGLDTNALGQLGVGTAGGGSTVGQGVTFTATVAPVSPGAGTPGGTVQFVVDGSNVGSSVALSNGSATSSIVTFASAGSHQVLAVYSGSVSFTTSAAPALTQTVSPAATSTVLTSSAAASVWGQSLTLTATVSAIAPGAGTPAGTVTFFDGTTTLGTGTLNGSGKATLTTSSLSVASHSITAAYTSNSNYTGSTSTALAQSVSQDSTTTRLASSVNPSIAGQSVTFTATVAAGTPGSGTPSGSVSFFDGVSLLGTGPLNGSGHASFTTANLSANSHSITATYAGDGNFVSSASAALSQVVSSAVRSPSTTALASSANPSVFGQAVTLTATVTPADSSTATPTGTIQFVVDGANMGNPVPLTNGSASSNSLTMLSATGHNVSAVYSGDANFSPSAAANLSQTVGQSSTSTSLASSNPTAVFGQTVTLTATVAIIDAGVGTPTGNVTFMDGAMTLGSASLNASGLAAITVSSLATTSHALTATYAGDGNFAGSAAPALTQIVGQASTASTLTSSSNPAAFGQAITFTATVSAAAPGAGIPTGSVTFMDGIATLGTAPLNASGHAAFATSMLPAGSQTITATYGGDANFTPGNAANVAQVVAKPTTTTSVSSSNPTSVFGQQITLTATVANAGAISGTPTGSVTFTDGTTTLGSAALDSAGLAVITLSSLATASHTITATYTGDDNFAGSISPVQTQAVGMASSSTALTSSANPSAFGQSLTFTAKVAAVAPGAGVPTGNVTFLDGSVTLGTVVLNGSGQATFTTSTLAASSHSIKASYGGDTNFIAATSPVLTQQVTSTPPANDSFANAVTITGSSATVSGTNAAATKQTGEPAHAGNAGGASVWWTWKAPSTGVVAIDTSGSSFDTLLAVYTGSSVSALTAVSGGSNDNDPAGGVTSKVSFSVTSGTTYKIAVDGFNGASGSITLHLNLVVIPAAPTALTASQATFTNKVHVTWAASTGATAYEVWRGTTSSSAAATKISAADITSGTAYDDSTASAGTTYWYWLKAKNTAGTSGFSASAQGYLEPANDNFANATVITGTSATLTGTNLGATKETGEPNHPVNAGGKSVWWTWTATKTGTLTVDTHGSSFDTLLALYTGSSVSALTLVPNGANDDDPAGGTTTSKVSIAVTAGTTYRVCVDGYGGASGSITLHLNLV